MANIKSIKNRSLLDNIGISITSLCALHCLLVPILLPLLPFVGASFFAEDWFERSILASSIIIGFWSLAFGFYRYHRQLYPVLSLILGCIVYWNKDMFGADYEPLTILVGALFIAGSHLINLKLCRNCKKCTDH